MFWTPCRACGFILLLTGLGFLFYVFLISTDMYANLSSDSQDGVGFMIGGVGLGLLLFCAPWDRPKAAIPQARVKEEK